MRWLWETRRYRSGKNGLITVERRFGRIYISVEGYNETSPGVNAIWRDTFGRVQVKDGPAILLLGLGAGGVVPGLHRAFPKCTVTAVEHDPEMIALARELKMYGPYPVPDIKQGDALEYVTSTTATFDLIITDLFLGNRPPEFLKEKRFLYALKKCLSPEGTLLVNVCSSTEFLDAAATVFSPVERWKYRENWLGMFSK